MNTTASLNRLYRRVRKERARARTISRDSQSPISRERAHGEATVLTLVLSFIREELRKTEEDL